MKERIALWDNIKFIMIVLVVTGHFADVFVPVSAICKSIYLFIYAFHMPVFFFVSGLYHRDRDITKKCLFYISAGFALKMILTMVNWIRGGVFRFSVLSDATIPWFMFAMAAFTALCYILRNQNKKYIFAAVILLACFAGYDSTIGDYLYLSRIIVFFPYYLLGTMMEQKSIIKWRDENKWGQLLAVIALGIWFYLTFRCLDQVYVLRGLFTGRNPFGETFASNGMLIRLCCYGISFATGAAVILLSPKRKLPFVTKAGKNSIDVYFWHWPLALLLNHGGLVKLFSMGTWGKASYLACGMVLTVILSLGGIWSFPMKQIKNAIYKVE